MAKRKNMKHGPQRIHNKSRYHAKNNITHCNECGNSIYKSPHHNKCETCWIKNRLAGSINS